MSPSLHPAPGRPARASAAVGLTLAGPLHPATGWLLLTALASLGVAYVLLPVLGLVLRSQGTRPFTLRVLHLGPQRDDSWAPMARAMHLARRGGGKGLYEKIFFEEHIKFQYPPTSLLVMYLADLAGPDVLRSLSLFFIYGSLFFVYRIYAQGLEGEGGLPPGPWRRLDRGLSAGLWFILALTFYPLLYAYELGQIQVWINAWFAGLLWCWVTGRKACAGVLLGMICLIKPHYGLLLLWGLLRRQRSFLWAALGTGLLGLVVSVALFGLENHLEYFQALSYIGRHGEAFYPNQSFNGLLNRALGNGNNLVWEPNSFAPFHPVVYLGTLAAAAGLLGAALFGPAPPQGKGSAVDLALVALSSTLASPVAWEHHYGILLPIFALLYPRLCQQGGRGQWWALGLLGLSYVMTANLYPFLNRLADTPLNWLQSYLLLGALLVLALLYYARRMRAEVPAAQASGGEASAAA